MSTDIVSQCRRSFMGSAFDPWPARIKNTEPCLQVWDKRGDPILPPYNKTVSHERTGIGPTEGGPNNGPEYPRREGERKRERERERVHRVACVTREETHAFLLFLHPFSLLLLFLLLLLLHFLLRRREQREHRAWMEEQCTPYINIVPITRSPGGYRSSKTPANFGRRTAPTREALSSGFRFSTPLLLRPLSNEKARTRSDETLAGFGNLLWIATEFRNGFFSEGLLFVSCARNLDLCAWKISTNFNTKRRRNG